jgi:hypothetical protein
MKIYINSRGYRQTNDYDWQEISSKGGIRVSKSSILSSFSHLINLENLILSEFSVLLIASENELLLVVTDLEPPKYRIDIKDRIISNSLALVGNFSDKDKLRSIAVSALENKLKLSQQLEDLIEDDDSEGFRIKVSPNDLLNQLTTGCIVNSYTPNPGQRIQPLSPENKLQLAKELQDCILPQVERDRVLVVVKESASNLIIQKENVWRGLTNKFIEDSIEPRKSLPPALENIFDSIQGLINSIKINKGKTIFGFLIIIITLLNFVYPQFWLWMLNFSPYENSQAIIVKRVEIVAPLVELGTPLEIQIDFDSKKKFKI